MRRQFGWLCKWQPQKPNFNLHACSICVSQHWLRSAPGLGSGLTASLTLLNKKTLGIYAAYKTGNRLQTLPQKNELLYLLCPGRKELRNFYAYLRAIIKLESPTKEQAESRECTRERQLTSLPLLRLLLLLLPCATSHSCVEAVTRSNTLSQLHFPHLAWLTASALG